MTSFFSSLNQIANETITEMRDETKSAAMDWFRINVLKQPVEKEPTPALPTKPFIVEQKTMLYASFGIIGLLLLAVFVRK